MSYTQYEQYGGNPYSNAPNMEGGRGNYLGQPPLEHEMSNMSATSDYSNSAMPANPEDSKPPRKSLAEIGEVDTLFKQLSKSIDRVEAFHREAVNSADSSPPAGLEAAVADTQTLNTTIRNNIKYLEADAARSPNDQSKAIHVQRLRRNFQGLLQRYLDEEKLYKKDCADQIRRQYRIVYPNASQTEVDEASQQHWGNEGVFQTALRDSTRSRQVNAAAGSVLTRHNEITQIEKTIEELSAMFQDMAQLVEAQEPTVQRTEENAVQTAEDVNKGNVEMDKANEHARRRRRLKWWCLLVVVLIIIAIALGVGLGVGLAAKTTKTATGS